MEKAQQYEKCKCCGKNTLSADSLLIFVKIAAGRTMPYKMTIRIIYLIFADLFGTWRESYRPAIR